MTSFKRHLQLALVFGSSFPVFFATAQTTKPVKPWTAPTSTIPITTSATASAQSLQAGCQLILNNPTIEFGKINLYDAEKSDSSYQRGDGGASIGKQLRTLHVTCSVPTKFALRFRAAADVNNLGYMVGKRGVMLLNLTRAQADGKVALLTANPAPVVVASNPLDIVPLAPTQVVQAVVNGKIGAITSLTVQVEIEGKMDVRTQRLKSNLDFSAEGFFELVPV